MNEIFDSKMNSIGMLKYTKIDDKELYVMKFKIPRRSKNPNLAPLDFPVRPIFLSEGSLGSEFSWLSLRLTIGYTYAFKYAACLDEAFLKTTRKTNLTLHWFANGLETFSETPNQTTHLEENPHQAVRMNLRMDTAARRCTGLIPPKYWPEEVNEMRIQIRVEQVRGTKYGITSMNTGKYFLSKDLSDVTIKVGNHVFPCHRFVLHDKSPVFAIMFEYDLKETQNSCVELNDVDVSLVREFLRFLYVGEVEGIERFCCELFEFAHQYMVEELKSLCEEAMLKYSNKENVLTLLGLARKYELPRLAERTKEIFAGNKKDIFNSSAEFLDLVQEVPDVIYDLIME